MRSTGIIRRIDDLGRIVIPNNVRKPLKIREGTPLEIFVDKNSIILTPYHAECVDDILNLRDEVLDTYAYDDTAKQQAIESHFTEILKLINKD